MNEPLVFDQMNVQVVLFIIMYNEVIAFKTVDGVAI